MKIAFSGSSGSGKTTLVTFVAEKLGLPHISGSAGDVKTEGDKRILAEDPYDYPGGGHVGVIRYSALNPEYGWQNQLLLQMRRQQIIEGTHPSNPGVDQFVTDRSPADNITYCVNQVGFHPYVNDQMMAEFFDHCLEAWQQLTHVIYVKAVQPHGVEVNGSRVANKFYQKAIDAQFEFWIGQLQSKSVAPPELLVIDYWDLETRKTQVLNFLGQ